LLVATCKYRCVPYIGDENTALEPMEGPHNVYLTPLSYSGVSGLSEPLTSKIVQIQTTSDYVIRFGGMRGEDPGAPDVAKEFKYPVSSEPRRFACAIGARFRIIAV
jgi:hypothetical protein